ncbi:hypothetical protein [Photobacterium aquae]|uniref:hypothetical protein n=1 Tax=Photobacterium aquae TaxID=1195763 RepID=UPI0012ED6B35|nr:hypothetical protein [Photobacterium aquae]
MCKWGRSLAGCKAASKLANVYRPMVTPSAGQVRRTKTQTACFRAVASVIVFNGFRLLFVSHVGRSGQSNWRKRLVGHHIPRPPGVAPSFCVNAKPVLALYL